MAGASAGRQPRRRLKAVGEPVQGQRRDAAHPPGRDRLRFGLDGRTREGGVGEFAGLLDSESASHWVRHGIAPNLLHY